MGPKALARLMLVALSATVVAGQTLEFTGINSCGSNCINTSVSDSGCGNQVGDAQCICQSSQLSTGGEYSCCVMQSCSSSDANFAQEYMYGFCSVFGGSLSVNPHCSSGSSSGSSSSGSGSSGSGSSAAPSSVDGRLSLGAIIGLALGVIAIQ